MRAAATGTLVDPERVIALLLAGVLLELPELLELLDAEAWPPPPPQAPNNDATRNAAARIERESNERMDWLFWIFQERSMRSGPTRDTAPAAHGANPAISGESERRCVDSQCVGFGNHPRVVDQQTRLQHRVACHALQTAAFDAHRA